MEALSYQLAFHREGRVKVRPIYIPHHKVNAACKAYSAEVPVNLPDVLFELAFYYGQNDFQPKAGYYSVSCGDILEIRVDGVPMRRMVEACGFSDTMSEEKFKGFMANPFNVCPL